MNNNKGNIFIGVIAIVISIIALTLSWFAYNKPEETNLGDQFTREFRNLKQDAEIGLAKIEARARLLALKTKIETQDAREESLKEIQEARQDFGRTYDNATEETLEEWRQIDTEFERLENGLRNNSEQAKQTLQGLLDILKR